MFRITCVPSVVDRRRSGGVPVNVTGTAIGVGRPHGTTEQKYFLSIQNRSTCTAGFQRRFTKWKNYVRVSKIV